jgi:hypothetical protein
VTDELHVIVRPASDSELRWVKATWSRAMRATTVHGATGNKAVRIGTRQDGLELDASLFSQAHHALVDRLLGQPGVRVDVACLPDVPDEPVGWCSYVDTGLHFVFVVPYARNSGVARKLIAAHGFTQASHMTADGLAYLYRYLNGAIQAHTG